MQKNSIENIKIEDIKPLVQIDDISLYILISIVLACSIIFVYLIYKIYKLLKIKLNNPNKIYLENLKNIDLQIQKKHLMK